jgi:hypothetical protein
MSPEALETVEDANRAAAAVDGEGVYVAANQP